MTKKLSNTASIIDVYDGSLIDPSRIRYPNSQEQIVEFLESLPNYKQKDVHIGIVDGAYDVPTENHVWSLRDARHRLAEQYFGDEYRQASSAEKQKYIASDKIILIVTIDADQKVADKKGFKEEKGNTVRPVYCWEERANRIGGFMLPDGAGGYRPVADIITVDGDPRHKGTPLESHLTLGAYLVEHDVLGTWLLYPWHEWFEQAVKLTDKYATMSQETYAYDKCSGERSSSTAIINRIKGGSTDGSDSSS